MAVVDVNSQVGRPLLHLLDDADQERRDEYLRLCVPLQKAALKGDWKTAELILEQDWTLVRTAITKGWATTLHMAAGANQVRFVEELVRKMNPEDLELRDQEGNTAFCFAAVTGNLQVVEIMLRRNEMLPKIRGGKGKTALHMAAFQGRRDMACYLYPTTIDVFEDIDWIELFSCCVYTEIYDLALKLLKQQPDLAFKRNEANKETALHILARKRLMKSSLKKTHQLQLVKCLMNIFLSRGSTVIVHNIRVPSQAIFNAVEVDNSEFVAELISAYPDLIREVDERNRSIIHTVVLHRRADIFNLIHDIGPIKDFIVCFLDKEDQSNLLHMAAKLAPPDGLNLVSGAAFQMTLELLWFEEVKKIMPPTFIEMKNTKGLTPRQLFTQEHKELISIAESWMKKSANSFMVVSSLIATGVFSAAFTIPGGLDDFTAKPNYLKTPTFLIFAIHDAIALISSSASILIFLSIIVSRYTEDDFSKSLPFKLIFGLVTLFISLISMMVAFSSAFFVMYYSSLMWVPKLILGLSFLPATLFAILLFPIWSDIVHVTNSYRNLFRRSEHMLH